MHPSLRRGLLVLGLVALAFPGAAHAQLREIVTKNVSASSSGASLELEFADDGALRIAFENGDVRVDGDVVGSYEPGDDLDREWRSLLGRAMALEDGALAEMLAGWTAPASLGDEGAAMGDLIDRALQDALEDVAAETADAPGVVNSITIGDETSLVRVLMKSVGRLGVLDEALSGLGDDFRVHVDEDVTIQEEEVVEGNVVVIDGALRVDGRVEGDVVVVGGTLDVREGGVIEGEARVADTRILRSSGDIRGGIVDVLDQERDLEAELRDRLRDEIREELRSDLRNELRNVTRFEDDDSFSIMSPLRPVIRGVGGVFEKLVLVFVLGLLGAGFLAFAGENVDTIAETARRAPARAAMVGFAGSFLLIPVWLLGAVALAVSIIGIPVAIAWLPLFPLAAVLAAILGYIAVARNAGEWLAESGYPWTGWIRKSNPIITLVGGLLGLSLAFIASHVISMAPFLGVLSGLLFAMGVVVTIIAAQVGFGAVLLTRAGRRREYSSTFDADAAWEAAMNIDMDVEEGLDAKDPGGEEG